MATANMALNRPRGPALIPPQAPPGTTTQPHATFCAPLFILHHWHRSTAIMTKIDTIQLDVELLASQRLDLSDQLLAVATVLMMVCQFFGYFFLQQNPAIKLLCNDVVLVQLVHEGYKSQLAFSCYNIYLCLTLNDDPQCSWLERVCEVVTYQVRFSTMYISFQAEY